MIDYVLVSTLTDKYDSSPRRVKIAWSAFVDAFRKFRKTTCRVANCKRGNECVYKNGTAWSPAVYPPGTPRQKQFVEEVSLLVIDLDHLTEEQLAAAIEPLTPYQRIVHPSHSDRPPGCTICTCGTEPGALHGQNCPSHVDRCIRAIVALSRPVTRAEWPRFWPTAMAHLKQPADPSCCDANRLYYKPSRPKDADTYHFEVHDGAALDVDAILAIAPPEAPSIAENLRVDPAGIVERGQRHAMLKSTAGALRFRGAGYDEIEAALLTANKARCNPPKSDAEVKAIAKWAADRPLPRDEAAEASGEAAGDARADDSPSNDGTAMPPRVPAQILEPRVARTVRKKFERNEEGRIKQTQKNVLLAMRAFGVTVTFDQFAGHELIHGLEGFGPRLDDAALNRLWLAIDGELGFRVGKQFFITFLGDQAQLNRFNPVREYLDKRKWDRAPRVGDGDHPGWLTTYAGAPDTPYVRAVSRLILVAAVRRVRQPGAKFDEMPIIEGEQGCEKSSALRVMAVREDWFADDLPLGADTKKLIEATSGKWLVEAGELKGMSRTDVAALKSYLSRQMDESRMSYDRKNTVRLRQFVIVGTTNEYDGYLKDPTGNRRFWPVRVQRFDLERLRADRDQLWAEAAEAEAAGESIRLDPKLYPDAAIEQDARRVHDPIAEVLTALLGSQTGKLRVLDVWAMVGIEPGKSQHDQITRVGNAMRELGWEHVKQLRFEGVRYGAYVRGTEAEREKRLWVEVDPVSKAVRISRSEPEPESPRHSPQRQPAQDALKDRLIAVARSRPEGFPSATELECAVKGNPKAVSALIKVLLTTGELEVRGNAIHVRDPKPSSQEGPDARSPSTNGVRP